MASVCMCVRRALQPLDTRHVMNAAARVIMNLSLRDHVKPALKQLHWLSKELHTSCVCLCITSMLDGHHNTYQIVYPQFLHSVADTG